MKLIKLVLLVGLFYTSNIFSQSYYFENYSVKEGLGQSDVYALVQDGQGIIWIGTPSGLSKFDGKSFINFNAEHGLATGGVRTIFIDKTGKMWLGHNSGGISTYSNGKFKKINLGKIEYDITSIVEDDKGNIWISSFGSGCIRISNPYDKDKALKIARFAGDKGLSDRISKMVFTKKYGLLFITDFGVKIKKNDSTFIFANDVFVHWPRYFSIITVKEDSKGNLWLGTHNGGVYIFTEKTKEPKIIDIRDGLGWNWISTIDEDNKGNIWIGSWGGGITLYQNGRLKIFNKNSGLNANFIRSTIEDYEGNILIGDKENGLFIFKGEAFIDYTNIFESTDNHIYAINRHENNYLIGSDKGLFLYNYDVQKTLKHYSSENQTNISSNQTRFIKKDISGNFWVGTWGGGVYTYNPKTQKIDANYIINNQLYYLSRGDVSAMTINKFNHLYIGTYSGLLFFDINNNQFQVLTQIFGLAGNDITALYSEPNGDIWVGSRGKGISLISKDTILPYTIGQEITPTCFLKTNEGLWVGTEGIGAFLIKDKKIIKKLNISDGLISNLISSITTDKKGNIFFGTNLGVSMLEIKTEKIRNFGTKEGFTGIEVKHEAAYVDEESIWYGTVSGLTRFFPNRLDLNTEPPKININRLRINLKDRELSANPVFSYDENSILIDFQAISISNSNKVAYQVMMVGADKNWQPITQNNFANYSALPPGDYTFKVKAINALGNWTDPVEFSFRIKPPFWLTWWFFTIIIVILTTSIIVYIKYRERALKREKAILEHKVQQRTIQIREANLLLAQKNKDITDSINYAKRIQSAIMPSIEKINDNTFIYYRPKDIVSGDFYWFAEYEDKIIIAAADCTGHGVPGAFMSMISISGLNQIVKERGITDPGTILNNLREMIINDLTQSGDGIQKDGLDIALLTIDRSNQELHYAGAYNSLFVRSSSNKIQKQDWKFKYSIFDDNIIEIKADRMPIGMSDRLDEKFETKTIKIDDGDAFFISSDGYIDQFGGIDGKKFMSKRFKETISKLPQNQRDKSLSILQNTYDEWKGSYEQIDDVLVIGLYF